MVDRRALWQGSGGHCYLATPGLLLVGLDQFPQMRGLAASCQAFAMVLLAGLVTQLVPTFGGHALVLGLVQGVLCIAAFA
jgi:DHA1 family bicyclomycin/chloramphenicol resistance-like MFS transporter